MAISSDLGTTQPVTALPNTGATVVSGGVHSTQLNATVQAAHSGNTITPTKSFTFPWRGHHVSFHAGVTAVVETDLKTALTAASAPFNTP